MKTNKRFYLFFILAVMFALTFTACFNGQQGDEASIIINLGGSTGNRAVWPHVEYPTLSGKIVYKVKIDGPDQIEIEPTDETIIERTVTPGRYTITVEALCLDILYAKDVKNVTIKAGPNPISIKLKPSLDSTKIYLFANGDYGSDGIIRVFDSLAEALTVAKTEKDMPLDEEGLVGLGLKKFTVSIGDDYYYLNNDTGSIFSDEIVTIEKHGNNKTCIKLDPGGPLFSVYGVLTLQGDITLEGVRDNYSALIVVNEGGKFYMYDNVVIKDNENKDDGNGGGVCVFGGGEFNMRGGEISYNSSLNYGGGVYVALNGKFNMQGGKISDNKAGFGGGVFVEYGGIFDNNNRGTIIDNKNNDNEPDDVDNRNL